MKNILYLLLVSTSIFSMQPQKSPCDRVKNEARRLGLFALAYEATSTFSTPLYYDAINKHSMPPAAIKMTKFYISHLITLDVAEKIMRQ